MTKLLGQRSGTAWAGWTVEHKHRAFLSRWQSLLAATGSLEKTVLPLLLYWLSLTVKKVSMLCRFASLNLVIIHSLVGLWVKIWHRNKTACPKSNSVQSSRSKSIPRMTCPKKGRLLRFESNSTVTSEGGAQKALKWYLARFWINSNQSLQPNRSQMKYDLS